MPTPTNPFQNTAQNTGQSKPQKFKQKFSLLEFIIIALCIFFVLFSVLAGVINQTKINEDKIRIRNLISLTKILDQYYNDSSSAPYSRRFPISQCSTSEPNSIDFEHTLYQSLTGIEKNSFKYLEPAQFPQDLKATFKDQLKPDCLKSFDTNQYSSNNRACDYNTSKAKSFCYLYATSSTGDKYDLSFYSDSKNKFVLLSQLRDNDPTSESIDFVREVIK